MSLAKEIYKSTVNSLDEFKADERYSRFKPEIQKYVEQAMENGCSLGNDINGLQLFIETKDNDGNPILFHQSLYNDPRDNTFIEIYDEKGNIKQGNRCSQCSGINIWEVDKMIDAAYVCGKCKCRIRHQDELHWVMYAGLECESCAETSWAYINSKPSGYWTS